MTTKTQLRGHCQCCGRQQAVLHGRMAHHGYTVDHGYFNGTCQGHDYAPIEHSREQLDEVCVEILADCRYNDFRAQRIESGEEKPLSFVVGKNIVKARGDLNEYDLKYWTDILIAQLRRRAQLGRAQVEYMQGVANTYHGKDLIKVEPAPAPEPIPQGEKRLAERGFEMVCRYVDRGMVHWRGNGYKSSMSTRKWRTLTKVGA